MRLPVYLLLPIGGTAVLIAAVLGAWLWPEPTVSVPSGPSPAVMAPAAAEAPPPPPPSAPRELPSKPVPQANPPPAPVAMPAAPPPSPVAKSPEPASAVPTKPMVPINSQITDLSREQQTALRNRFFNMSQRAAEMAERGAQELQRQQEEARARGDVAEVNRLEEILRGHRERMERMRQQRIELAPAQAGPPTQ